MLLAMCHRCEVCRSVRTYSVRREVAPLPSAEASLFRSEGRERGKRKRPVADEIGNRLLFLE